MFIIIECFYLVLKSQLSQIIFFLMISVSYFLSWVNGWCYLISYICIGVIEKLIIFYLQESNRLFSGEKGYGSLRNLQKRLRTRQQYMISQVSLLYPVKISVGPEQEQELELFPSSSQSGICQWVSFHFFGFWSRYILLLVQSNNNS